MYTLVNYSLRRMIANLSGDRDEMNNLKEERKAEREKEQAEKLKKEKAIEDANAEKKKLAAKADLSGANADLSGSKVGGADISGADISGAKVDVAAEDMSKFSVNRLFKRALDITKKIVQVFVLIALILFGASLATNLNVYRELPYRILYAIYGGIFFFVVIPYVLLWRWAYKGKRPKFYALLPILDKPFEWEILANLFSWMTFQPDDEIKMLDGCSVLTT